MNLPEIDFATRRAQLAAEIARQRGELAQAYSQLEKPLHYAEYGMRGFGFLRQNSWLFVAAPALFSMLLTAFGSKKKKSSPAPDQKQSIQNKPEGAKKHLVVWGGRAWRLYQLYRRVRHFLP